MTEIHLSDDERRGRNIDKKDFEDEIPSRFSVTDPEKKKRTPSEGKQLSLWDDESFPAHNQKAKENNSQNVSINFEISAVVAEKVARITKTEWREKDLKLEAQKIVHHFLSNLHDFLLVQDNKNTTSVDKREATEEICHIQDEFRNELTSILVGEDKVFAEIMSPFYFLKDAPFTQETFDEGIDLLKGFGIDFKEAYIYSNN